MYNESLLEFGKLLNYVTIYKASDSKGQEVPFRVTINYFYLESGLYKFKSQILMMFPDSIVKKYPWVCVCQDEEKTSFHTHLPSHNLYN